MSESCACGNDVKYNGINYPCGKKWISNLVLCESCQNQSPQEKNTSDKDSSPIQPVDTAPEGFANTLLLGADDLCPNCNGLIRIRNPTGKCDHLYYPENVPKDADDNKFYKLGKRLIEIGKELRK